MHSSLAQDTATHLSAVQWSLLRPVGLLGFQTNVARAGPIGK